MAFDISTLVTDRKQSDVAYVKQLIAKIVEGTATEAELAEWDSFTLKGSYNYTDLNRVNAAMEELKAKLESYGYAVPGYRKVRIPHTELPSSRLPSGYTELEYIQSSGTQYIDSGLVAASENLKVDLDFEYIADFSGSTLYGSNGNGCSIATYGSPTAFWVGSSSRLLPTSLSLNTRYFMSAHANSGTMTVVLDGVSKSASYSGSLDKTKAMYLFAYNNNGTTSQFVSAKFYSCQIYDNGTLVRDYIPCITTNGEVGLYDAVNEEFYGNDGTGLFLAGPRRVTLPDGYRQVEYIESSGTQYIDTGVISKVDNFRVAIRFSYTSVATGQSLFGAQDSSGSLFGVIPYMYATGKPYLYVGTSSRIASITTSANIENQWDIYAINGTVTWVYDSEMTTAAYSGTPNQDYAYFMFANNLGGTANQYCHAKLYACQIYDNGMLIREFVPCVNPSGAYGLYDIVNAQFYGNAGTGSFTGGVVVEWDALSNTQIDYDPYLWYEIDTPTPQLMENYLANVQSLHNVLELFASTPATPDSMSGLTYSQANAIEQILFDIDKAIKQTVSSFVRLNAFTAVSGNRPLPSVDKDIGRTWAELDAMQTIWRNWDVATWFLLLHGNLTAVETEV